MNPEGLRTRLNELLDLAPVPAMLAQEVWGDDGISARVHLRQVLVWDASDHEFQRQNAELFNLYRHWTPAEKVA